MENSISKRCTKLYSSYVMFLPLSMFSLTFLFFCSIACGELITGPYLQNVKTDGITVMWELSEALSCTVEYGPDAGYGNTVSGESETVVPGSVVYKSFISGLLPDTVYHYRVVIDNSSGPNKTFKTAPAGYADFSFGVWGDSQGNNGGSYPPDLLEPTNSMMAHMSQRVDFGVSVGDLAENGNSYNDTRNYYLDRVAKYLGTKVPWFNAWGNHDGSSSSIIRKFADMPSAERGFPYHNGYGSFSFKYARCHFLCIDDLERTDFEWIKNDLYSAKDNSRFIFVFVHRPVYCERWYSGEQIFREDLVPLLETYGVDVCFSGHTHSYGRGYKNGVYYCITGGGSWLDSSEPLTGDWPHMTVGGYHDLAAGINGGLVNEYVQVSVNEDGFTAQMTAFNPDGSVMTGVKDIFSKSSFTGDIDGSGFVDSSDLALLIKNWLCQKPANPTRTVIPDFEGMTETSAKETIRNLQLYVAQTEYTYNPGAAAGTVIAQTPEAGKEVDISTGVSITVAYDGDLIFSENFDVLTLGPNVHEWLLEDEAFTHTPPSGWYIDAAGVSTINDPDRGVHEWQGWSFTDKVWWAQTAGGQNRSQFTKANSIIAVADPDEWDDRGTNPTPENLGTYNTFLKTPEISLNAVRENTAVLFFDSSWRPEDYQKASIRVSFDGGVFEEIMTWTSTAGENYKADATNETVSLILNNPPGTANMVIEFGLTEAGNDWWWAIDNLKIIADKI